MRLGQVCTERLCRKRLSSRSGTEQVPVGQESLTSEPEAGDHHGGQVHAVAEGAIEDESHVGCDDGYLRKGDSASIQNLADEQKLYPLSQTLYATIKELQLT
jgi:hypothetical protein